jgi:D-alanine-D-alanine ligase
MHIAILHPAIPDQATLEDQDTLVQVRTVAEALERLGHEPTAVGCTLDLAALRDRLTVLRPDLVFNLVESVDGADSLQYVPAAVLDVLGLPYTGNSAEAVFQTTHKLLAKQLLHLAGLPTPAWLPGDHSECHGGAGRGGMAETAVARVMPALRPPCIVKAVWEHASRGLDDQNVMTEGDAADVEERLRQFAQRTGRPCFAEQFIEGREFNLSILDGPAGPEVLPPAEIDFSAFPAGKPRIVGHRAKWEDGSFEFHHTPRRFDFPAEDQPLVARLCDLALACWRLFDLRGYVRVDFRVDSQDRPWILEINTNPCLSPDAGFAAAVAQAGISLEQAVERILEAVKHGPMRPL